MAEEKMAEAPTPASTGGMDPRVAIVLSWIFAPIASIIFIATEKENKRVKFHAWESMFWGIFEIVVSIVVMPILTLITLGFGGCLYLLLPLMTVVNIVAAIKGWNGEDWKLPVIGEWAENQANK